MVFLCILLVGGLTRFAHAESERLSKLSALYRMNISAEVYLAYCDTEDEIDRGAFYVSNLEAVKYFLAEELNAARGAAGDIERVRAKVDQQGLDIAKTVYRYFQTNGCVNDKGFATRKHAEKIGKPRVDKFLVYLRGLGKS